MPPLFFFPILLALSSLSLSLESPEQLPQERQLLFTALLIRHGDRTPLYSFPTDPLPLSAWPEGIGMLTAIGAHAQYVHGTSLRTRYVDTGFLPESYDQSTIFVRSTDVDRTLLSADALLMGLYPPGTASLSDVRERFGADAPTEKEAGLPHRTQIIPVHTTSRISEDMLVSGVNCPRHAEIMAEKKASAIFRQVTSKNAPVLKAAKKITGSNKDEFTLFDLSDLYDTWAVYAAHGVPLHKGATPEIVSQAKNLSDWLLTYGNTGKESNRLRSGVLLNDIKERIALANLYDKKVLPQKAVKNYKKLVLYSAHDTTLAAALSAMRVFDGTYPPYNSTITWELYKNRDGLLTVRVEYNGAPLLLPGCDDAFCPIAQYLKSTHERTVPGPLARRRECMTGVRRYASMAWSFLAREKNYDAGDFGLVPEQTSGFPFRAIFYLSVGAASVLAVALVIFRVQRRYNGYAAPGIDKSQDVSPITPGEMDALSGRRILM